MKLGALTLGGYMLIIVLFGVYHLLLVWSVLLYSFDQCKFEVYFVQGKYCYSCLFWGAIGLVNLPAFHPKPVLVSVNEMGLL
jgi:hypothetical protein